MTQDQGPQEIRISLHTSALLGALSLALAVMGCKPTDPAPTGTKVEPSASTMNPLAEPPASATGSGASPAGPPASASGTASAEPSASASGTPPAASASASAIASASPPRPPPPRRPPPSRPVQHEIRDVEGRPFLVAGIARLAPSSSETGWSDPTVTDKDSWLGEVGLEERALLIEHYTRWALAEHASIASFARFGLQLLSLGAPADLVARATAAMGDEIRHAKLGFGLVERLSGKPCGPGALAVNGALDGDLSLEGVLRLTVREGMIGETLAALEALVSADLASPPALRMRLAELAQDESRHSELAYAFAAWALGQDPSLLRVIDEEAAAGFPPALPTPTGLGQWGVLDTKTRENIRKEGFRRVIEPALASLTAYAHQQHSLHTSPARRPELSRFV